MLAERPIENRKKPRTKKSQTLADVLDYAVRLSRQCAKPRESLLRLNYSRFQCKLELSRFLLLVQWCVPSHHGYRYRAYVGGGFLAVNDTTRHLYYLGPLRNNAVLELGVLSGWVVHAGP